MGEDWSIDAIQLTIGPSTIRISSLCPKNPLNTSCKQTALTSLVKRKNFFCIAGMESDVPLIGEMLEGVSETELKGKAPDLSRMPGTSYGSHINAIPSSRHGACTRELVTVCFNRDNLHERLREMIYHAGIYCKGMNHLVAFVTTKWDPTTYEVHRVAINTLENEGVKFIFVLLTERDASRINP